MPSVGAESMTTPAEPRPRASSSWVSVPPNEWPMMIGGSSSRLDDLREVVDGLGHGQGRDGVGVLPQRLDLDLEAGVGGGQHAEALGLVVRDPVLPAARGHPEAVDEDDRVGRRQGIGHGATFSLSRCRAHLSLANWALSDNFCSHRGNAARLDSSCRVLG